MVGPASQRDLGLCDQQPLRWPQGMISDLLMNRMDLSLLVVTKVRPYVGFVPSNKILSVPQRWLRMARSSELLRWHVSLQALPHRPIASNGLPFLACKFGLRAWVPFSAGAPEAS